MHVPQQIWIKLTGWGDFKLVFYFDIIIGLFITHTKVLSVHSLLEGSIDHFHDNEANVTQANKNISAINTLGTFGERSMGLGGQQMAHFCCLSLLIF